MADQPKPTLRPRRILERPRLLRALDRSQASIRMLVAPPGFGKTTLAEQWSAQDGRRVAWVRARQSSADVAVLARQVAAAGAEIVAGCDRRLCERLNATQDPAQELGVLVDLLSEDLAAWPEDAWLVVDDYQHIAESAVAEAFLEGITQSTPVQLLIGTRDRPRWVSPRSVLYGDVLEIGQSMLAMSEDEVDEMLAGARDSMSPGLLALAGGWPAVIGLASLSTAKLRVPSDGFELPEQLYEFFADEVYRGLEPDVRTGLGLLATAPSLDRELAVELLGKDRADRVCAEALTLGVLEERGGKLELHPLAAAFLEERARRESTSDMAEALSIALGVYRLRREWDAAFDVLDRGNLSGLDALLEEALDDLLNSARLETVTRWADRAASRGIDVPLMLVARAEVELRHGQHTSAQAMAARASTRPGGPEFRAVEVAARAAHAGSREGEALELYRRAASVAITDRQHRKSMWGQVTCAGSLELEEAHEILRTLEASTVVHEPHEAVRLADKQLSLGFRFGYVRHLKEARRAAALVASVDDPFVRCSFRSMFSWGLSLGSFYEEANEHAVLLLEDAAEYRVDIALSHAYAMVGYSLAGKRQFEEAHEQLRSAAMFSRSHNDPFAEHNAYALTVRVLLQEGRAAEACAVEPPDATDSLKSMRGEVLGSRALALATLGRIGDALALGSQAAAMTRGIEANVLWSAVRAVAALKARDASLLSRAEELVEVAFDSGAVDVLVCAYRSNPDLLATLLNAPACAERTVFALGRAGDHSMAESMGLEVAGSLDPRLRLSAREREVYALVCAGLSNREVATRLFITEGTVKVHVHHIFDKLGIRSRTALALNAMHERKRQATSTNDVPPSTSASD